MSDEKREDEFHVSDEEADGRLPQLMFHTKQLGLKLVIDPPPGPEADVWLSREDASNVKVLERAKRRAKAKGGVVRIRGTTYTLPEVP